MKADIFIKIAIFFGMTGIIFGALAAHTLSNFLSTEKITSFQTGVKYQIFNSLFLLIISLNINKFNKRISYSFKLITMGILFFSFSIYALSLQEIINKDLSFLGPITPIGGLLIIIGWFNIFFAIKKNR
tara:strand:+ start:431 stop:817 length:387 start_codon:yes stop_codon:yes gene_type:complete